MLLATRVGDDDCIRAPDDTTRRGSQADASRDLPLEVHHQSGVAVHDPPSLRRALGRIPLLGERLLAHQRGIGAVEALDETACELALLAQRRTSGLVVEELLERAILLAA